MSQQTHRLAKALDDYLSLTHPDHAGRREIEAYLGFPYEPDMPPALSALARLRWEAEQEVERLIALMDALDADPDMEVSADVDGNFADEGGFEPNLTTTAVEDASGIYAALDVPLIFGGHGDECEPGADDEPSFGWRGDGDDPVYWCGESDALELEASWPESAGRGPWPRYAGSDDDEDSDPASNLDDDNGIADAGGLAEQLGGCNFGLLT